MAASEPAVAADAATEFVVDGARDEHRDWLTRCRAEPETWRQAVFLVQNVAFLTAEELAELNKAIIDVLVAHPARLADPSSRSPGARPVRLRAWGFPTRDPAGDRP